MAARRLLWLHGSGRGRGGDDDIEAECQASEQSGDVSGGGLGRGDLGHGGSLCDERFTTG